ncbi:MAG: hypothetical protein HOE90_18710 [Bacteriovoracaceae bacterium]|jgi:hypothetical protein|nr:hypothetical protein [Bacteriovoracaceae bacterium]
MKTILVLLVLLTSSSVFANCPAEEVLYEGTELRSIVCQFGVGPLAYRSLRARTNQLYGNYGYLTKIISVTINESLNYRVYIGGKLQATCSQIVLEYN